MVDWICPILKLALFQVDRDTPVCEFKTDGEPCALGFELIGNIEIDQYIRLFDVQVEDFLVMDLEESLAYLVKDNECGRLIVGLGELGHCLEGAVLAVLKH